MLSYANCMLAVALYLKDGLDSGIDFLIWLTDS